MPKRRDRKSIRQAEAAARREVGRVRTNADRLALLDDRPGESARERQRLSRGLGG